MLTAILTLSLLGQCPGGQCALPQANYSAPRFYIAPADEWRPFAANPNYEVYGHIENGVFYYTQYRAKATAFRAAPRYYAPVLQYGSPCANGACPR